MQLRRLVYLAVVSAVLASCGVESEPSTPTDVPALAGRDNANAEGGPLADGEVPGASALAGAATFDREPAVPQSAQRTIGPEGGTLSLGEFEIVVPAGAVDRNTLFMIRRPQDAASRQHVLVELRPHNVAFAAPVTIRFPLTGTSAWDDPFPAIGRWEGSDLWSSFPSVVIEGGARIETSVHHFSFYAVRRKAELTSGG